MSGTLRMPHFADRSWDASGCVGMFADASELERLLVSSGVNGCSHEFVAIARRQFVNSEVSCYGHDVGLPVLGRHPVSSVLSCGGHNVESAIARAEIGEQ